jgi:hypothetical protein
MPWQQYVADVLLEIDPDTGRLAYQEFGLTVPRQSGKSTLLLAKAVHRATATKFFGPRQQIVYTAQTRKDARKKWEEDFVEDLKASRAFRPPKAVPHFGNGNEHIRFSNRSRFGIESTTEKAGHGGTIDEAYIDEAFAQVDGRMEQAFGPAMITRRNKQLGWISTAGWKDGSPYLQDKVAAGRAQVELGMRAGLAYFEWSAGEDVDPRDRDARRAYMPALGYTIADEAVDAELDKALREGKLNDYLRAYMNRWVPRTAAQDWTVIPKLVWRSRRSPPPPRLEGVALAVSASWPDADRAVIAAAGRFGNRVGVQVVDAREGWAWVPPRLAELRERWKPVAVAVRDKGPTAALHAELKAAKADIVTPWVKESAAAVQVFCDGVMKGEPAPVAHFDQPELDDAVAAAKRKPSAGEGFLWDQPQPELEAAGLAVWGHTTRVHLARSTEPLIAWA